MQIQGNCFLVTGASSGLGAACARSLVQRGGRVVLADMNEAEGRALADELADGATFALTDVTDSAAVQAAIDLATGTFGPLAGVIHCAGVVLAERVLGRDGPHGLESFERVLAINVVGTFNVVRLAAAAISGQAATSDDGERGVLINTSSCAAFEGQIGQAAYSASKSAVAGMTLPLARELARFGIRVVAIAPGTFDTPMLASLPEPARQSLAAQVPFPSRLGRPEEFAMLALHIIENPMLNGEVIRLDGAIRMGPK